MCAGIHPLRSEKVKREPIKLYEQCLRVLLPELEAQGALQEWNDPSATGPLDKLGEWLPVLLVVT